LASSFALLGVREVKFEHRFIDRKSVSRVEHVEVVTASGSGRGRAPEAASSE
jgi:hypothetical protein